MYQVTFIVNETKAVVTKTFSSPYQCRKFVNKLYYSKKLTLISCPIFN